jgi:hypothetical protein
MPLGGVTRLKTIGECDTIASRRDLLRPILWSSGLVLIAFAGWFDRVHIAPPGRPSAQ